MNPWDDTYDPPEDDIACEELEVPCRGDCECCEFSTVIATPAGWRPDDA